MFEEEEVTLPLFAALPNGSYAYCQKTYSGKILTDKTVTVAQTMRSFVDHEINKYEQILSEVDRYEYAKKRLGNAPAVVCISSVTPYLTIYDIDVNHELFKIFRPYWFNGEFSEWVAIFNIKKATPNSCITLEVPKHMAGLFIGKGGSTITALAKEIGVKKIQVIPI